MMTTDAIPTGLSGLLPQILGGLDDRGGLGLAGDEEFRHSLADQIKSLMVEHGEDPAEVAALDGEALLAQLFALAQGQSRAPTAEEPSVSDTLETPAEAPRSETESNLSLALVSLPSDMLARLNEARQILPAEMTGAESVSVPDGDGMARVSTGIAFIQPTSAAPVVAAPVESVVDPRATASQPVVGQPPATAPRPVTAAGTPTSAAPVVAAPVESVVDPRATASQPVAGQPPATAPRPVTAAGTPTSAAPVVAAPVESIETTLAESDDFGSVSPEMLTRAFLRRMIGSSTGGDRSLESALDVVVEKPRETGESTDSAPSVAAGSLRTSAATAETTLLGTRPQILDLNRLLQPGGEQRLAEQVRWSVEQGLDTAEIKLHPPSLGTLDVRIIQDGEKTHVQFVSAHPIAREVLEAAMPRLREALAQDGVWLGNVSVSDQAPRDRGETEREGRESTGVGEPEIADDEQDVETHGTISVLSRRLDVFT